MTAILYLDTETTGLDPDLHDVWEIGAITEDGDEYTWMVRPDLTHADPNALKVNGYYGRARFTGFEEDPEVIAATLARLLAGAVVIGSNPDFDRGFLRPWLRRHGQAWAAHYRTVDVVTLGAGALHERAVLPAEPGDPHAIPLSTTKISRAFGVDPDDYARHTALGDCKWTAALYKAITEGA